MKKLIILLIILLTGLVTKAQVSEEICVPTEVARAIQVDLLSGDSAKALLKITDEELRLTKNKVDILERQLVTSQKKIDNLTTMYNNETLARQLAQDEIENVKNQYNTLSKQYKKLAIKKTTSSVLHKVIIGGLVGFIAVKTLK